MVELQQLNKTLIFNLPVRKDKEGWSGLTQLAVSTATINSILLEPTQ